MSYASREKKTANSIFASLEYNDDKRYDGDYNYRAGEKIRPGFEVTIIIVIIPQPR
jgi:hypothetical protein